MKRTIGIAAAAAATALTLTACGGGSSPLSNSSSNSSTGAAPASKAPSTTISVGAANFPESQVLADLYAGALNAKGVKATTGDPIGAREVYLKALKDGSIDLVPEYMYSLLTFYDKTANQKDPQAIYNALKTKIPATQVLLNKSQAQDANSIAVTKATADKWHLKTIADLAKHSSQVTLAAPPEFKGRQQGLLGLQSDYHFTPKFIPLQGNAVVQALKNGQAQAANIFTTDPSIITDHFVLLQDPKHIFGSDNVVPLMNKAKATPQVTKILNAVQAKLTTANLGAMDKQVQVDHKDPQAVANQFLKDQGLS
ncbi:ABC transporter substrate-binding protein [Leekyejoonella antrihumi]|uniref:ABC transporter substrate-binding protein n=1 Tax=Leekyejoonella antrihumi TaxID=1660198 RepID=A0A563E5Y6_9MICO|nr:ABC transporter substrate-binding protein [Leekyejoonella antrihumi]TWP37978.1 ABC transporter substrate-binding protein [Leekyejoonella antrihumi]